jgi:acyl-homoserine lactone acylase PvdQ
MQSNATATTIGAINTPVKAAGTTTASALNQSFTHSNNRLTYNGTINRVFKVDATVNLSSGNNNNIGVLVAKNGTVIDESRMNVTTSGSGAAQSIAVQCLASLTTNDYLELWVRNNTSTTAITVTDLNLMATPT